MSAARAAAHNPNEVRLIEGVSPNEGKVNEGVRPNDEGRLMRV